MHHQLFALFSLPLAVLAQDITKLFVDGVQGQQWAGSILDQNACGMTVELVCTAGTASLPNGYGIITCDTTGPFSDFATASATYSGTSIYEVYQSYAIARNGGIEIQAWETCSLYGSSRAICTVTASGSTAGQQTVVTTVSTASGATVANRFVQVQITGGSSTSAGSCRTPAPFTTPPTQASSNAIASSSSSAIQSNKSSGAGVRGVQLEVRKVVIVPAAAMVLLAGIANI